jgi:hypothetical protein
MNNSSAVRGGFVRRWVPSTAMVVLTVQAPLERADQQFGIPVTSSAMPAGSAFYKPSIDSDCLANDLVRDAIRRYRGLSGFEGDIVEAAWEVEQLGIDAWPTLEELAGSGLAECEFFVGAMARIADVPDKDRSRVLRKIANNPNIQVRARLLEIIDELPSHIRSPLLAALASEARLDDSVSQRARERL